MIDLCLNNSPTIGELRKDPNLSFISRGKLYLDSVIYNGKESCTWNDVSKDDSRLTLFKAAATEKDFINYMCETYGCSYFIEN